MAVAAANLTGFFRSAAAPPELVPTRNALGLLWLEVGASMSRIAEAQNAAFRQ